MKIRTATITDAPLLSALAFQSKAYWGYSDEFMEQCKAELEIHANACDGGLVRVVVDGNALAGFYQLSSAVPHGKLSSLFVDPRYIGKGIGKQLLLAAAEQARSLGFASLEFDAGPHAEAFYLHMGAARIGSSPSGSIPGRELPRMLLTLE